MNDDYFEDDHGSGGLLDDKDSALDYMLYEKMRKEDRGSGNNNGCLGLVVIFLLPAAFIWPILRIL